MWFNLCWNISRAVGVFRHYMVDYSQWMAPLDFRGTGERTGKAASVPNYDRRPITTASHSLDGGDSQDNAVDLTLDHIHQRVPLSRLLPYTLQLVSLMSHELLITPAISLA